MPYRVEAADIRFDFSLNSYKLIKSVSTIVKYT